MENLFDFSQPNLKDIEIVNGLNQYIELSVGRRIYPLSSIRISSMNMTLEMFKELLPKSALPAFIRAGAVTLKPHFSTITILSTPDKARLSTPVVTPTPVEVETNAEVSEEESPSNEAIATIVVENTKEENPFGHETNIGVVENTPPNSTVKVNSKSKGKGK